MIEHVYKGASVGLSHKYKTFFKRMHIVHSKRILHVNPTNAATSPAS